MDHRLVGSRVAVVDRHPEGVGDQRGGLVAVDGPADQPTTRRENTSRTTQQYTLPSRVGCSVMSVTHNWSGAGRSKRRSTKSAVAAVFLLPRKLFRAPGSPCRPWIRMIFRTVLRLTITPCP
jgi:hypothetical protein